MTTITPPSPPRLITLVLAAAASAIAMNLFLPSLPGMAHYFKVDYALMQLTVTVYLIATAFLQLLMGPMSDRFGRRPVMIGCFAVFIVATLAIIVSPNFEFLLAMRVLQAFSAAGLVLSRAIVRDLVEPAAAAGMIGYITMGMALAPMIAPAIGGLLDERYGWQATFVLMLLIGIVSFLFILFDLSETHHARNPSFMTQVRTYPELLLSSSFWGYVLIASFTSGQFYAFLGGGPFVATEIMHLSPSGYGLLFGTISLGYVIGNFLSGRYSTRFGIGAMMLAGNGISLAGGLLSLILLAFLPKEPLAFFGPVIFVGLGNGLALPNAIAGMVSVRRQLAGSAAGLGSSLQIGFGAILSVLGGAFLTHDTGAFPLVYVMVGACLASIACAFYVIILQRGNGRVDG